MIRLFAAWQVPDALLAVTAQPLSRQGSDSRSALGYLILAAIVAAGLVLRLVSARGGLWVDEAWSALHVSEVATPLDIFVAINHDNNHHINSLWMQLVGIDADPLLTRALSIASGTITILVAASIGAQRSFRHAIVLALLFAVSPILVNYGAEARGYAPMLLAATCALALVQRWLTDPAPNRRTALLLGIAALAGLFSQLTMAFFLVAIVAWCFLSVRQMRSPPEAMVLTIRLFAPSLIAVIVTFAIVFGAATASPTGMQVGGYQAFSTGSFLRGFGDMFGATLGLSSAPRWAIAGAVALVLLLLANAYRSGRTDAWLHVIALIAFPGAFFILQIGNAGFARYYLLCSISLLMLIGLSIGEGLSKNELRCIASALLLIGIAVPSVLEVRNEARLARGDPDAAVLSMMAARPRGTAVLIDHARNLATLQVSARRQHYPLLVSESCKSAEFLYKGFSDRAVAPAATDHCGQVFARVVYRRRAAMSGVNWALYRRSSLSGSR